MSVLKSIFGPSKEEIWTQIAHEIGGEFGDRGLCKAYGVAVKYKEWTIFLDSFANNNGPNGNTVYTRIRAPFVNKDGLYFKIYRENFFSSISKLFGMQDIQVGDPYFDNEFIIKGNSEEKIQKLLKSDKLKELIRSIPRIHFEVKDDDFKLFKKSFPEGVDMLYFTCVGTVKDKATLRNLFLLFSVVLERLVQIDSAYENDPMVELT